eukprot:16432314-Heterocapsa_arctica.AAC.1
MLRGGSSGAGVVWCAACGYAVVRSMMIAEPWARADGLGSLRPALVYPAGAVVADAALRVVRTRSPVRR